MALYPSKVDLEILPEPSDEERQAIVRAMKQEGDDQHLQSAWQRNASASEGAQEKFPRARDRLAQLGARGLRPRAFPRSG
jgi:hypothetical protein